MKLETFILPTKQHAAWMKIPRGVANGYVSLPADHPCFGLDYEKLDSIVDVHGGVTFAVTLNDADCKRMGFPLSFAGTHVVGFDTCHAWDNETTCDINYVNAQTAYLARQLEAIGDAAQSLIDDINNTTT